MNAKAKKIKEQATEIKEKNQTSKRFSFALSRLLGVKVHLVLKNEAEVKRTDKEVLCMTFRYQKIRGFITNSTVRFRFGIGYAIKIYSLKGLLTHKIIFSICKHERMANCCGCFFVNGRVVESKNGVTIDQHDCCRKPHSMFTTSCKEELRKIIKGKKRISRTGR